MSFGARASSYAPAGGGGVPLTHTFLQAASSNTNATIYTFSTQNLGTAAADRTIVVVAVARSASAATQCVATIGGISAGTPDAFKTNHPTTNADAVAIFRAEVPTGTTGDIVIDWGAAHVRCGIAVYRIVGGTVEVDSFDTNELNAGAASDLVLATTSDDGVAIAGGTLASSTTGITWTNATEDHEGQVGTETSSFSAASTATTAGGLTITYDWVNTASEVAAAVAYRGV